MSHDNHNHDHQKSNGSSFLPIAVLSAGLVALYFLTGEDGERNRRKVKSSLDEAGKKISGDIKKAHKNISKTQYYQAVEEALEEYKGKAKDNSPVDIDKLKKNIKEKWNDFTSDDDIEIEDIFEETKTKKDKKSK